MPNAQEEFLKSLESDQTQADPFAPPPVGDAPLKEGEQVSPTKEETEADKDEKFNRRERRLQAKLQAERESSIALAARLSALEEARKSREEATPAEYLKTAEKIYGTGTPEAAEATELLKAAIKGAEDNATRRALEMFREEQRQTSEAVSKEEKSLENMIEEIEDETGVEIDAQTRKGFFQMLEKLSPKDSDGNIIAYADHHSVWEELQARKKPADTRAKDLASRSMVRTGASPQTSVEAEAQQRWLIENGLI